MSSEKSDDIATSAPSAAPPIGARGDRGGYWSRQSDPRERGRKTKTGFYSLDFSNESFFRSSSSTAEEAALAVARFLGPEASRRPCDHRPATSAPTQAAAAGMDVRRKHVGIGHARNFQSLMRQHHGGRDAAPQPAMTAAEALAAAAAEGLALVRSRSAGFKGVYRNGTEAVPKRAHQVPGRLRDGGDIAKRALGPEGVGSAAALGGAGGGSKAWVAPALPAERGEAMQQTGVLGPHEKLCGGGQLARA